MLKFPILILLIKHVYNLHKGDRVIEQNVTPEKHSQQLLKQSQGQQCFFQGVIIYPSKPDRAYTRENTQLSVISCVY